MAVSIDYIEAALGRTLTDDEEARALVLIEMAEGLIEDALPGFSFAADEETVTIHLGDPTTAWTPRYPVTALALTRGGTTVPTSEYQWTDLGKITGVCSDDWVINASSYGGGALTVTYSYGLDPPPASLAALVASAVATILRRGATNPTGILSERLGPYEVSYGSAEQAAIAAGMSFTPRDLPRRWRRDARTVQLVR